jgi:hypothetical protein
MWYRQKPGSFTNYVVMNELLSGQLLHPLKGDMIVPAPEHGF